MKDIFLYTGSGAYQAKDLENCLDAYDIKYERICEHQFNKLTAGSILIVGGGDPEVYLKSWDDKAKRNIINFVKLDGIYVGICAGVFVADKIHNNLKGLGLVSNINDRQVHSNTINVRDSQGYVMEMIVENNPDLTKVSNSETVLFDQDDSPVAIKTYFYNGQVYLFSHHPEGSTFYKKLPHDYASAQYFAEFLKNL